MVRERASRRLDDPSRYRAKDVENSKDVKKADVGRGLWCRNDRFYNEKQVATKYGPKVDLACDGREMEEGRRRAVLHSRSVLIIALGSFGMLVRVCDYACAPGLGSLNSMGQSDQAMATRARRSTTEAVRIPKSKKKKTLDLRHQTSNKQFTHPVQCLYLDLPAT
ncbi:hypothetical protein DFH27DRAFT_110922 [Peziza echinospora]|nr:hypothetical protein DFH27DRAFT_110922 [Peziza echinospora]